jgi:hypothetical protein
MIRRLYLVCFTLLIALVCVPAQGAAPASVSGSVRDSSGIPQIGAEVELLRPDLSVAASVYTNASGRFVFSSVLPGRYAIKAMGASFLPALRENVRVRANTVVNLTLNTLYEAMQWLPAEPRSSSAQQDDWKWTLRSAANRPLLRWLENGPLVVVSDGPSAPPRLKARIMATGQEGSFGESGQRISATIEETPSNSRELLARVDFDPGSDAAFESMLGFRQDLGFAGSVQSVAAVALHPEIDAGGGEGLDEAAIRTWKTMNLGDELEAEVGSSQVLAQILGGSDSMVTAALPFATVDWRKGDSTVSYRMVTLLPGVQSSGDSEAQAWLPQLAARGGQLLLEHGLHQEVGWERSTDASGLSVLVFADHIDNPVVEAMSHFAANDAAAPTVLFDNASGLLRAAAADFSSAGLQASYERRMPGGNRVRLSYANGDALVMAGSSRTATLAQMIASAHPHRAQTYSLSLSGTLDGTGTRWWASYRWQPEETVTQVAPYALDAAEPYLNLHLRQPIRRHHEGARGFEALLDVRNLLAQGYRPFLSCDGSVLIFAQDQRSIRAGLGFTF